MLSVGTPFKGKDLERLKAFLKSGDLGYENGIQYTVNILDDYFNILATGSLEDNILKCILVHNEHRRKGLAEKVISALVQESFRREQRHLFVFTKPENSNFFRSVGFYRIAETDEVVFMENIADGVRQFVSNLECRAKDGIIGSVFCKCDPFTKGHLYLIEAAASQCDLLHVFVISDYEGTFTADARINMVKAGTAHLMNVVVHSTGPYAVSLKRFPKYFLKSKDMAEKIHCELDLKIFYTYYAMPLGITLRYIGKESDTNINSSYNNQMEKYLNAYGIKVVEIQKFEIDKKSVSATNVKKLLSEGELEKAKELVPPSTWSYLSFKQEKRLKSAW